MESPHSGAPRNVTHTRRPRHARPTVHRGRQHTRCASMDSPAPSRSYLLYALMDVKTATYTHDDHVYAYNKVLQHPHSAQMAHTSTPDTP